MKLKVWTKYNVGYLPTKRCRKLRYKEQEEYIDFDVKEIDERDLNLAFDTGIIIYSYDNRLWRKATERDIHCENPKKPMTALESLIYSGVTYSTYFGRYKGYSCEEKDREQREDIIARAEKDMSSYLIVDGVLYVAISEPMYCIYTFGLGHNHAGIGTSLSIVNRYNSNISKECYFNALEYDEAVNRALDIASNRGDTNSFGFIKETTQIKVFDNKYVTRNPQKEHGDGNAFLNNIESVIESSDSVTEAGLLAITLANSKN